MEERYYHTEESAKEYINLAKNVDGKQLIKLLKLYLKPKSTLLEIGSGPGTDWKILREDFEVIGSDYSEEFIKYLKSTYPQGEFLSLNASSIEVDRTFDGIYSNKVLHHLKHDEIVESIKCQNEILKEDGLICHSFWKGEGSEIFKGMFVKYYNKVELKKLFEPFFSILYLEHYKEFEDEDSIVLIARKNNI